MNENKDYLSYLIGAAGLFLSILSLFRSEEQRVIFLIWGAAGVVVAVIMIYIDQYKSKVKFLKEEVANLKKEYSFSNQVRDLKQELNNLFKNRKGSSFNVEDIIKIIFLFILVFFDTESICFSLNSFAF